ncbi:hypothetical protein H0H92_008069, partial [Tricholoma furcatifolium]
EAARRRKKRKRQAAAQLDVYAAVHPPRGSSVRAISGACSRPVDYEVETLRASSTGYTGLRFDPRTDKISWTLEECLEAGYEYISWNGRDPRLLTDENGCVAIILAGRPNKSSWDEVCAGAAHALDEFRIEAFRQNALLKHEHQDNRRGDFPAVASGVSMGGGRVEPGMFRHSPALQKLIDKLLLRDEIQHIGNFQSNSLLLYAPKFYTWLSTKLEHVMKSFRRNFSQSIFPAVTFNVGPRTQCFFHVDQNNLAHGLCAITALGNYNPIRGGHIILRINDRVRLVVEFPPTSTIFIPSASIPHGNTPVQADETRFSFTQYCAGGLVRWVDYGFQTVKSLCSTAAGRKWREDFDGPLGSRWRGALNLFSKVDELDADRQGVRQFRVECEAAEAQRSVDIAKIGMQVDHT